MFFILFISGEWRYLLPNRHSFKEAWQVLLHDLRIRKAKPPAGKIQCCTTYRLFSYYCNGNWFYITGLAIYKPVQLWWLCAICGGYTVARIIHFVLTIGYVLFFLIHIIQVILAGWNNFRAMITGFEVVKIKDDT